MRALPAVLLAVSLAMGACERPDGAPPEGIAAASGPAAGTSAAGKFRTTRDVFSPETFAARRARLAELIPGGLVVLLGGKGIIDAWEEHRHDPTFRFNPFRQEENLFYLTGAEIPGIAVILDMADGAARVYVPERTRAIEAELERLGLGAGAPHSMDDFEDDLAGLIADRPVYMLTRHAEGMSASESFAWPSGYAPFLPSPGSFREDMIRAAFQRRFPDARVHSVVPAMEELRKVKDAEEIEAIREAVWVSAAGLRAGLAAIGPGVDEREVAAEIEYVFKRAGAQLPAYAADVQSGPNSMHSFIDVFASYDLANRTMQEGEMVLMDHSAEVNYYISDLARSVPVSGRFSADQRLVYDTYMEAYEAGLDAIEPGVPFMKAARVAAATMRERYESLPDWFQEGAADFIERFEGYRPGHFLGMNLHIHEDYESPLQPGQVMAYELHLYVPERGWRITVEDVVLVTDEGYEILSNDLPREAEEIERVMAGEEVASAADAE